VSDPSKVPKSKPPSQRALIAVGVAIIASLVALGIYTWRSVGDVAIDANGYVALVLGIVGTVGLGGGLMALLFLSHRSGYDDQVGGGKPPVKRG
jgi:hypothetical protein